MAHVQVVPTKYKHYNKQIDSYMISKHFQRIKAIRFYLEPYLKRTFQTLLSLVKWIYNNRTHSNTYCMIEFSSPAFFAYTNTHLVENVENEEEGNRYYYSVWYLTFPYTSHEACM